MDRAREYTSDAGYVMTCPVGVEAPQPNESRSHIDFQRVATALLSIRPTPANRFFRFIGIVTCAWHLFSWVYGMMGHKSVEFLPRDAVVHIGLTAYGFYLACKRRSLALSFHGTVPDNSQGFFNAYRHVRLMVL
eukprot:Gregarina_sp_Poly_1__988@NODE_123_length_13493_cov_176_815135_g110_i0_p9_GENE_NODE_123_length_13493_cov_176_815135_g110_i0NODE_123_length_13493_cov_176_815135_g110_i0_p9_ORF_typecomplete_len134_score0_60DUF4383/PF14325_6/0_058_NODE_123_length_13493_cov_176_815135_g110_i01155411955